MWISLTFINIEGLFLYRLGSSHFIEFIAEITDLFKAPVPARDDNRELILFLWGGIFCIG